MNTKMKCHECGSDAVAERVAPVTHKIKQRKVVIEDDRHLYCEACGSISYRGSMLSENQRAIADKIRDVDRLLSPALIKDIRTHRLGLTQTEMEELLRLGKKTWVRWERGKIAHSKQADLILRMIENVPGAIEYLVGLTSGVAKKYRDRSVSGGAGIPPKPTFSNFPAITISRLFAAKREVGDLVVYREPIVDPVFVTLKGSTRPELGPNTQWWGPHSVTAQSSMAPIQTLEENETSAEMKVHAN